MGHKPLKELIYQNDAGVQFRIVTAHRPFLCQAARAGERRGYNERGNPVKGFNTYRRESDGWVYIGKRKASFFMAMKPLRESVPPPKN